LEATYSPDLSIELRIAIAQQLGLLSQEGWPIIKLLFEKYGPQPELIQATGTCYQPEAKYWLLMLLEKQSELNHNTL